MSSEGAAAAGQAPNTAARNASLDTFMTVSFMLPALFERHPFPLFGAGVNGARTDDFTVDSLLDDMRGPTRSARDDENRCEHRGRHAHPVIGHRTIPVQIGEHPLFPPHYLLEPLRDVEELHVLLSLRKPPSHLLDHLVTRIARGIDRMAEADDDFLAPQPAHDVGLGFGRIRIA